MSHWYAVVELLNPWYLKNLWNIYEQMTQKLICGTLDVDGEIIIVPSGYLT